MQALLQEMMHPSNEVFEEVVKAKNFYNADTGTIIRTFVSAFAREKGIEVQWPPPHKKPT